MIRLDNNIKIVATIEEQKAAPNSIATDHKLGPQHARRRSFKCYPLSKDGLQK